MLQRIFKFRTCSLDIDEGDERWRWFRPCLLASINQCTAPCNLRISKEDYRRDIDRLRMFLEGKKASAAHGNARGDGARPPKELKFEKAARLRDEIRLLETLDQRGELDTHVQPEVFYIDPKKGPRRAEEGAASCAETPRTIEGVDIAHLGGGETVASLVQFIDGLPFKPGYGRYKIRGVEGVDDFAQHPRGGRPPLPAAAATRTRVFPDILLIDGGKGQLNAGPGRVPRPRASTPPVVLSLAKREEEIYLPGDERAAPAQPALLRPAAAAIRPRRSPPLRPALSPHPAAEEHARRVV